jgi:hypothetical protein
MPSSPNIKLVKGRMMRWVKIVVGGSWIKNAKNVLVGKSGEAK